MSAVKGTSVLIYANGKAIAMQRGLSISFNGNPIDASNKESLGWYECIMGQGDAKIDFNALFSTGLMTDNPTVLSAKDLLTYLISRTSLLVSILDLGVPIVGEVFQDSMSFEAPNEGVMTLAGSFKVNGPLYALTGSMANLITDPDSGGTDYDTLSVSGLAITSAIKSTAGTKYCQSNVISVADAGIYKLALFLTSNSGALPTVGIWNNTSAYISNTTALVAGLNIVTLTSTATDASASLRFSNTGNANWSCGNVSLFRFA